MDITVIKNDLAKLFIVVVTFDGKQWARNVPFCSDPTEQLTAIADACVGLTRNFKVEKVV